MAVLTQSGNLHKRFLETVLLLKALNEVQGVPSAHGLDSNERPSTQRAVFLKRKFLDSFAFVCATRKGGANVSAACMEENQSGETIIRLACNTGVRESVLSDAQAIIQILTRVANGECVNETSILSKIISMDSSRIHQYLQELKACHAPVSRPEIERRISKHAVDAPLHHVESLLEWFDGIPAIQELDCENEEKLLKFIRHAQRAKHDYAELLHASFRTDTGQLEKWLLIVFKLGRYGIASRAFAQLAFEQPTLIAHMAVHPVMAPEELPISPPRLDLDVVLRRLNSSQVDTYRRRLSQIWKGKGTLQNYFARQCPDHFSVHAELQLVSFYDDNPHVKPSLRFIGVSKKSCYLCNRFLANHPLSLTTSACHQKLYSTWAAPSTKASKVYNSYKSIIRRLICTMEAAIKQELDSRSKFSHRLVPPDSSAGVSLSGITEPRSIPVMSGALLEEPIYNRQKTMSRSLVSRNDSAYSDGSGSVIPFWGTPLQAQYTGTLDFESQDCIHNNEIPSTISPLPSKIMTMVLHFERADNHLKQEIVRVSEIFDHANQQPVWERLVEILSFDGRFRINFCLENDLLMIENHAVEDQRQFAACLQYLYNIDKLNGHCLVCDRNTIEKSVHGCTDVDGLQFQDTMSPITHNLQNYTCC